MTSELVVSYSELQAYRACPLRWKWSYKERWSKPPEAMSNLDKGTAFHAAAEVHYRTLQQWPEGSFADRLNLARQAVEDDALANMEPEMADLIEGMYDRYVQQWGVDSDWTIVGVEEQGKFLLGTLELDGETVKVYIKWKADVIAFSRTLGGLIVVDHKTCSSFQKDKSLAWDDQLPLYDMGYRMANPGAKILGGFHNEVRKPTGKSDPAKSKVPWGRRVRGTYTLRDMKEIADNALATVEAMQSARMFSNPGIKATDCNFCQFEDGHAMLRAGVPIEVTLKAQGFVQDYRRH